MNYHKLMPLFLTALITIMISSCGKKPETKLPDKTSLSQLAESVLFNPRESQDYQSALKYFQTVSKQSLTGEEAVLKGLAHIYQGEVYEMAAQMLSVMQLDLFHKSTDPDHGSKFPITKKIDEIKNELTFWMGVDAYTAYGEEEGRLLLTSNVKDPLYEIKQKVLKTLSGNHSRYLDQTFLAIDGNFAGLKKKIPILHKILRAEALFKKQEYEGVLIFLDDEELFNKDIFHDHKHVKYYSPAVFKLASLTHYSLGINELENSLQGSFTKADSTGYKIIAILNLGQKYRYFDDSNKLSALWNDHGEFLATEGQIVKSLVESNDKKPYCLDWIKFEDSIVDGLGISLPKELIFFDNSSDPVLQTMKKFIGNPRGPVTQEGIHRILLDFKNNPNKMDNYPTLLSGFIEELNLSSFSYTEKKLIQDVTEKLVFDIQHTTSSWHRNGPAFLLSLYGTLRWHGGRLPGCNGFLIDMMTRNKRLSSLWEITAMFTQALVP